MFDLDVHLDISINILQVGWAYELDRY